MAQTLLIALTGLGIGLMVGLTGIGGGALLVPILVLFMHVPPLIAVGTGALFVAVTKVGAGWSYHRQGHVEMRLVGRMALGSIPGAVVGVGVLAILRNTLGNGVNDFLKLLIGILLILTPAAALLKNYLERKDEKPLRDRLPKWITAKNGAIMVGFVGGCLVGMTSMGSGSIIMTLLVLFYNRSFKILVGTDIAHSVILATVASAGHFVLGTIDFSLLAALLLGSIPGAWYASRVATSIPNAWLKRLLFCSLVLAGVSML
jgi:uncharacterized membrane protein YfcA